MYQRRRTRILIAGLLFVALVLITMDVRAGDGGVLERLRGTATSVIEPVQDGLATLTRPIGNVFSGVGELFSLRSDNAELRGRVEQLEERRRAISDLERENDELRELLDIREQFAFETVAARAVAIAPSSFEWTMTIDVGSRDGVARDMPVVAGAGLAGRVIQVTPGASRVLLAIDPNFAATARTARTGEVGWINGRGGDPMLLEPLEPGADIQAGDEVVTASYDGGVFPQGIPIGVVSDPGDAEARIDRSVTVLPYVDFTQLHHVLVVLSAPVDPVPPLDETSDVPFVPPPLPGEDTQDGAGTGGENDGLDDAATSSDAASDSAASDAVDGG